MNNFYYYLLLFFIYSIFGWILEITACSLNEKKFVMRGFLIGPYCPIYGASALIMIILLERYNNDLIILFVVSAVIAGLAEYITSYIMEKTFKMRWWDYSEKKFNLNGRICLENVVLFGLGGLLLITLINPYVDSIIDLINPNIILIITIILSIIFIIDNIISYSIIINLKDSIKNKYKDYTEIIDKKVWDELSKQSFLINRLLKAFPNIKITKRKIK